MSEKRETDLINRKIIETTENVFPEETTILRASTNFMRRLTKISDRAVPYFDSQPSLRAVLELFCRNRELTHFSVVCMVNAGYSETKILSRVAFENFLLMRLFAIKPNIAHIWFSNPEKFRRDWRPETIRKTVFSNKTGRAEHYGVFYGLLCDYTHPSFKGWYEIFKQKKDGVFIAAFPEFNPDYASECIGLICFVAIQTVKVYTDFFKKWFDDDMLNESQRLLKKLLEILPRHFEVRIYDKKKLLGKQS